MTAELSPSASKVQEALRAGGFECVVLELPGSTRTSAEAAQAVGCQAGQIVKSLIFRGKNSGDPVLALVSGPNRVDEAQLGILLGEPVEKANGDYVRTRTGFVIGGVPPLGHTEKLRAFIDEDLLQYAEIWAAAGTPHAVFRLKPAELVRMTDGQTARIKTT